MMVRAAKIPALARRSDEPNVSAQQGEKAATRLELTYGRPQGWGVSGSDPGATSVANQFELNQPVRLHLNGTETVMGVESLQGTAMSRMPSWPPKSSTMTEDTVLCRLPYADTKSA